MYTYLGPMMQPHLEKIEYWHQILDDIDGVVHVVYNQL